MRKTLLLWFLMLLNILTYSVCASKSSAEDGDFRTSKSPMQHKYMYGVIMGSSKISNQRTIPKVNVMHRTGKPINGGGSSDLLRRPNSDRRSSDSLSIKPSSLFTAALRNLFLGLLLFVCFY